MKTNVSCLVFTQLTENIDDKNRLFVFEKFQGIMLYLSALSICSILLICLEAYCPARSTQKQFRKGLWSDVLYLVWNGHFLGLLLYSFAGQYILPNVDTWLEKMELQELVYRNAVAEWPVIVQIFLALFVIDFLQWIVHNLLHRIPFLWNFHKVHHSVQDGEMDWIVSFRFHWFEVVFYKSMLYLPMCWFGFGSTAVMVHAILGTLIGHLNHSNLDLGYGWWRFVLNNPRMHLWHHNFHANRKTTVNFGIIFSVWDWIFQTAYAPSDQPQKIGFRGVEGFPNNFFNQAIWPFRSSAQQSLAPMVCGVLFWFVAYVLLA